MPGGIGGWHTPSALHVSQTETGYVTHGIPVSFDVLMSPDGEPFPPRYTPRILTLLEEYGAICKDAGVVFPLLSVYRSLAYQESAFRPGRDTHTLARAMDLGPVPGWTTRRMSLYAITRRRHHTSCVSGIGIAPSWLHVEITPVSHRPLWRWPTDAAAD